ncbi:(2Fe-2S) ferredoxin domain-containing protein [Legionella septentrionalis]|uniref:(2Fe-2S) ferredoxin domain-containing protein n=1 Tax=Legionella septentrionalis TaxID=2498109 RepID=UPI0018F5ED57|nr:NAD(P)H-dependent oxidoreductase subunit E [Legionella septentrionalis]
MLSFYAKHIFICTNQKASGKKCCANAGAEHYFDYLKDKLKDLDLFGPGKVRVSQSGCLGRCSLGPCIVIYPEGVWYTYASSDDIDEIISSQLINGEVVQRLLIDSDFPAQG